MLRKEVRLDERLAFRVTELAKLLGVSGSFLPLEIARKRLRPIRLGRRLVVIKPEVARYLAAAQKRGA